MLAEIGIMAKKRQEPSSASSGEPGRATFAVRVSYEFKEWLTKFANFKRTDMADLFDRAIVAYAKSEGFEDPPIR